MPIVDFKFGRKATVKDIITGFVGKVVSRTEWLNGCIRYGVQSAELTKDGIPGDIQHLDEEQLVLVEDEEEAEVQRTGGPHPDESNPW